MILLLTFNLHHTVYGNMVMHLDFSVDNIICFYQIKFIHLEYKFFWVCYAQILPFNFRVKEAVNKKEEALKIMQQQRDAALEQCSRLEKMLEQRKDGRFK